MNHPEEGQLVPGTEPSHAYEHWIRLQTEQIVKDSVWSHQRHPEEEFNLEGLSIHLREMRHTVRGSLREKQYGRARKYFLFLATLLIKRAAWLHRMQVRYENDPS